MSYRRGYNMLEAVLAVFLFSIVVVFMMSLWAYYARSIEKSRNHMVATHLGERALSETIARGYLGAESAGPYTIDVEVTNGDVTSRIPYEWVVEVSEVEDGLKSILVRVWYPHQDERREVRFESLLFASN
ncbi:MAG: hypothetical protein HY319_20255 [Armatimonadetes bacterium]|nr:hypothetical protein [Armatimonadota bacterium]